MKTTHDGIQDLPHEKSEAITAHMRRDSGRYRLRTAAFPASLLWDFIQAPKNHPEPSAKLAQDFDESKHPRDKTTISRSKCRPLNSSSTGTNRGIRPSSPNAAAFAPEPSCSSRIPHERTHRCWLTMKSTTDFGSSGESGKCPSPSLTITVIFPPSFL